MTCIIVTLVINLERYGWTTTSIMIVWYLHIHLCVFIMLATNVHTPLFLWIMCILIVSYAIPRKPSKFNIQLPSLSLKVLYHHNMGNQFRRITILLIGTMMGFSLVYASNDTMNKTQFWDWIVQSLLVADWNIGEDLYMLVCEDLYMLVLQIIFPLLPTWSSRRFKMLY